MRRFVHPFKAILPVIITMCSLQGYTQNNITDSRRIDSIKKILQTQGKDKNKVNALNELGNTLVRSNDDETAFQYANQALLLAEKINFPEGKGKAINLIGLIYRRQKNYPESLKNYLAALEIFKETGDKLQVGNNFLEIANIFYFNLQNYPEALTNCFSALKFYEELGDTRQIAHSLRLLGIIYINQGEETTALKHLSESLKTFEAASDSINVAYTYNVIGGLFSDQGKYEEAQQAHFNALNIYEALGSRGHNFGVPWTYGGIGNVYEKLGERSLIKGDTLTASEKFSQALTYYERRLKVEKEGNMRSESSYNDLGNLYIQLSKISSPDIKAQRLSMAKSYLEKGLQSTGHREVIKSSFQSLSRVDSMLGDYKQAFKHYKLYILYRDSLVNEEAARKSLQLKMQYESDKKDAAAKAALQQRNLIIVVIIFLAAVALLMINRQRLQEKLKTEKAEKEKLHMIGEVALAREQMRLFTESIVEKTALIEKLESQALAKEFSSGQHALIAELSRQTILTEEDWDKFKVLFETLHPNFFIKLKQQFGSITVAEQRMAALIRLMLTTRQMASMLGISLDSVHKTRQRLRQRLQLATDSNIEDAVAGI